MALKLSYNKRNSLLALVLIGALIVDTLLSNISDILSSQLDTAGGVVLFVALAALVFGSAYYLLIYLKNVSSEPRSRKPVLSAISKMIVRSMFVLIAIVAIISLQVIFLSEYSILLFVAATFLGYILGGAIMALLGYYLLRWFMLNKKSIMVALFAAAAFMTAVASACLGISQGGLFLAAGPLVIHSHASINYPNINPELTGIFGNLLSVAYIETMLSYALTWAAASILLYHYSKRIGMKKYLTLVIVPMGAFVVGITPILFSLPTTGTYFDPKLLVFRIVSILSLIAVGILLGLAFRVVVKSIHPHIEGPLIDYLRISSYGLAFLFVLFYALKKLKSLGCDLNENSAVSIFMNSEFIEDIYGAVKKFYLISRQEIADLKTSYLTRFIDTQLSFHADEKSEILDTKLEFSRAISNLLSTTNFKGR